METEKKVRNSPYIEDVQPGKYAWCSCGESSTQPYCDGSHAGTSFTPIVTKIEESEKVAWCGCRKSNNKPFCDGTHAK